MICHVHEPTNAAAVYQYELVKQSFVLRLLMTRKLNPALDISQYWAC